jgi:NAD+ kinase
MNKPFKKIALAARLQTPGIAEPLMHLATLLQQRGKEVLIEEEVAKEQGLTTYPTVARDEMGFHADLAIVIGGDGTMLSVARLLAPYQVPIIGVNQGRLGFITDISMPDMEPVILRILDGECVLEERMLLKASVYRAQQVIHESLAFNDVVLSRGAMGSMIEFEVFINDLFVYSQRSDGLIISTPTGSTAYALAAGGPILHPTVSAMTIVPVCPQFLNNRPIVINDTCHVEYLITRGQDARVFFDNQSYVDLHEMDKVAVSRYQHTLTILHPLGYSYYDVLRSKLHWGQKLL